MKTDDFRDDPNTLQEAILLLQERFAETKDVHTAQVILKLTRFRDRLLHGFYPEDIPEIDVSQGIEQEEQNMPDTIVIDKEKMQVDRSTMLGQAFDKMLTEAGAQEDPAMGSLMNQVLAYTEASLVIDETVTDQAKKDAMLGKLRSKIG